MSDTNDQPGGDTGLLDSASIEDNTQAVDPQKAEIPHKSDGDPATPGSAKAKPDYIPDNFWNAEKGEADIENMAKSWRDLRAKISQGKHNAPADGVYDTSMFGEKGGENPIAQTLTNWAKENGLSQAQFEDLSNQILGKAQEVMGQEMIDPKAEMNKLGPNANAIINGMVDWARGLVNKGVWSKEDFDEFKIMGGTARGLSALMKIRESYEGRVPVQSAPMEGAPSKEELYAMVAKPEYQTDPAYRQKVERMFAQYAG